MVYYPIPIHNLPIYAHLNYSLPVAEQAASEVLSLPIWPQITFDTQSLVAQMIRKALDA